MAETVATCYLMFSLFKENLSDYDIVTRSNTSILSTNYLNLNLNYDRDIKMVPDNEIRTCVDHCLYFDYIQKIKDGIFLTFCLTMLKVEPASSSDKCLEPLMGKTYSNSNRTLTSGYSKWLYSM